MKTLGITGGVGMGKSTCAELLRARGVALVDTDDLARDVVSPGQPALEEVRAAFGAEVIAPDGQLRRDVLAKLVFAEDAARKKLEAILHPRIKDLWKARVGDWRSQGKAIAVVVIPLLFETKAEAEFDYVISVACSVRSQRERLRGRQWTDEQITQRIAAQMPIEEKLLRSHYVIWTEGQLRVHAEQLDRILASVNR
jgi:dephospho-CoA kinase